MKVILVRTMRGTDPSVQHTSWRIDDGDAVTESVATVTIDPDAGHACLREILSLAKISTFSEVETVSVDNWRLSVICFLNR